jgi:hypothetical protein
MTNSERGRRRAVKRGFMVADVRLIGEGSGMHPGWSAYP